MIRITKVKDIFSAYREELKDLYDDREIDQFVYLLLEHFKGWGKARIHSDYENEVSPELSDFLAESLNQLKTGKPVQYIIGMVDFFGARIKVAPEVLIPRPETEELVSLIWRDNAHRIYSRFSLLDIATGSGCIPVSLSIKFPDLDATATDISEGALRLAEENAELNRRKINFINSDILDTSKWNQFGTFDVIVSNPPYIPEGEKAGIRKNVLEFEPSHALFVPDEDPLLFYRYIAQFAYGHLSRPGTLYLEIHENYGPDVKMLLQSSGFEKTEIIRDLNGKDRIAKGEVKLPMSDQSYWHVEH